MSCSQCCCGFEAQFSRKVATGDLRKYRKNGPMRTAQMLIDALKAEGVDGLTLLDIGGGVGALQHELLRAGVRSATAVDASTAYLEASAEEAQRQGHADRVHARHGDFVAVAPEVEPADVVTLDRVICCYADMEALVALSAERAQHFYGVVYPRRTWWTRFDFVLLNGIHRLRRSPFRAFIHRPDAVDALIREKGFTRRFYAKTWMWQVVVHGR